MYSFFADLTQLIFDHPTYYSRNLLMASFLLAIGVLALIATRLNQEQNAGYPGRICSLTAGADRANRVNCLTLYCYEAAVRTFFNVYLDDALKASTTLIGILSAAGQLFAVRAALGCPFLRGVSAPCSPSIEPFCVPL